MDKAEMLLSAFMAGITLWIIRKYLNSLLQSKEFHGVLNIFLWLTYYIYQLLLERGGTGSIFLVLLNVFEIFLICHTGYYGAIRTKALYTVLLCVMWSIVEMVAFYLLQTILPAESPAFQRFGSVLTKLLLVILVVAFGSRFQEGGKKNLPSKFVWMLLVVSISGILIAYNIFLIDNDGKNILSMISFVILLFMNCIIFEIYQKLYENMEIERENAIFAQQLKLISKHEKEQEQLRREQREFHHNLVNFCMGIKADIKEGQRDKAIAEIDKLLEREVNPNGAILNCGNELLDSLINHKYEIAKKYSIKFELNVQIPEKLPVAYADLSVVLGNLIDNAIEATKECMDEKRVAISIGIKHRELVIVVRNTYAREPKQDKFGNFTTIKDNPEEHGFGIRSIKKIVDKYEGSCLFQVNDNMFEAIVLINLSNSAKND